MHRASNQIVGRFAPSPSGRMHLGNVFSCLMAWLAAKSAGGKIVLRIEDLDERARNRAFADLIMDDLEWLGLTWDDGPYYQSKRTALYEEQLARLDRKGLTYPCFCTRSELHAASAPHAADGTYVYQGTCRHLTAAEVAQKSARRAPATRLRVPEVDDPSGTFDFADLAFGPQHDVLATDCGDFLVRRSDGVFAYQLAAAVDDSLMGITQVVRGRDLLSSSARQMYLAQCLNLPTASYGHVPLLVAPGGRRLSKRDQDLDVGVLRARHTDPRAIIGWLAGIVGIAPTTELASAEELVASFTWDALSRHRGDIVVPESPFGA